MQQGSEHTLMRAIGQQQQQQQQQLEQVAQVALEEEAINEGAATDCSSGGTGLVGHRGKGSRSTWNLR